MARRARRRRVLVIVLVVLVALIAAGGVGAYSFLTRDEPVVYGNIVEQYKYGSIGTEELQGIPYEIWAVLPEVFADLLPPGPGKGYERFGFLYEPGRDTPIGTTYRKKPIGLLGLNCALCHVGTYRDSPTAPRQKVLGMPSNNLRLWDYIQFLRKVRRDERFEADTLLAAIERRFPGEALVRREAVLAPLRDSGNAEGPGEGGPRVRLARQPSRVRAGPRRHVQPP